MEEVNNIIIIPAIFLKKISNGYLIRELIDGYIEDKEYGDYSLEGIENPKYLLIGRKSGIGKIQNDKSYGFSQITFVNANDLEKTFIKKWMILLNSIKVL
jgi:hypothetical protein